MPESTLPTFGHAAAPVIETAARTVFQQGLRARDSAFNPGAGAWTRENTATLLECFVGQPDMSGDSFKSKLQKQLAHASDSARLLFAELYYLNLLPLRDYKGNTKRALIQSVLSEMSSPVAIPAELAQALDLHVFKGGMGFTTGRYWQLCYLIEFAHGFLASEVPGDVWDDPLAFRTYLQAVVSKDSPTQRNSLLYLAHPTFFLPMVSDSHRRAAHSAFKHVLPAPSGDLDRDLRDIYRAISDEQGKPMNFYREPWRSQWAPEPSRSDDPTRKAWLVRGSSVDGQDLIPLWREEGFVSLRASKLREVQPAISRDELRTIVNEDYSQSSYAAKAVKLDEFHAFLSRMRPDDLIVTTSQGRLFVGVLSGAAEYVPSPDGLSNLRRSVDWGREGIDDVDLPPEIKARLQIQYDVVEMTQQLDLLEPFLDPIKPDEDDLTLPPPRELGLPDATAEIADELNVDQSWLQECIDLLRDRPQLIFYGPPGTGKTFIAQHLANHLARDKGNVRLVQFHPAYSYEDFFEGYRPESSGGFALKPGPLRKAVDVAKENPHSAYFLIIDEINRGNLAKIFGELYFLLEYRDQQVDLLYATDDDVGFTLPKNVFIIGTMNTADRSIALVDGAMRRRFAFVPLHPLEPPTRGVLRRWLRRTGRDPLTADLLDELNRRIEDPDFKIGPSYFMRDAVHQEGGLQRTWRTAILPLLEEHHYGEGVDVNARYGLKTIRSAVETRAVRDLESGAVSHVSADPA
ncbi:MAG TPA: AAA domain-containing protein [Brevibacterium sp.]|nr:AAA domain-containing protein [Brevibacterium sp.]